MDYSSYVYFKKGLRGCLVEGYKGFLALGWHLKEIHVTLAHLEKKQTRLRTCTKIQQEVLFSERGDGVSSIKRRCRDLSGDGVWILVTASQHTSKDTRVHRKDTIG
ncbi:hypothetical protein Tco_0231210 [Tanacetum coccineum]